MNKQRNCGQKRMPFFDVTCRELRGGTTLIKRFVQKSDAQEISVKAFQEEGWYRVIDDPLTGKEEQDPKQRLRTAIANLNRRQRVPLLHFGIREQGTAVSWEFCGESDSRATVDNGEIAAIIPLLLGMIQYQKRVALGDGASELLS